MQLEISVLSNPGGRQLNEDACGFWSGGGCSFCVVSDGAGGHGGGDVASKLAVRTILAAFQDVPECTGAAIASALDDAHRVIVTQQDSQPRLREMRATATVLAIDTVRNSAAWSHVGDTRLYCFRERRVIARTKDHSIVQKMVDAGFVGPDALRESTQRSRLFAALGHAENFAPSPGQNDFPLAAGDVFLLCTDGFWEYVKEEVMERTLVDAASAAGWLRRMEASVTTAGGSGQDNFSALAVWCSDSARAPAVSAIAP